MTIDELLNLINEGLKNPLLKDDILNNEIKISYLKRIDNIFNKGLNYYLDTKPPEATKEASIFFRKTKFGTNLNIGSKKIVNKFEDIKISLSAIAKLTEVNLERTIPVYSINHDPKIIAKQLRTKLYPDYNRNTKEFLKALIAKFAEYNILIFEFVETWNKKDKANIDGFFLNPNVIVLKRQQMSFKREIFTLVHELGHYLINEEEIEQLDVLNLGNTNLSKIERWCNDFTYYFLVGQYEKDIDEIIKADSSNDYHFDIIENISKRTHLSEIALFTKLLFQRKISQINYNKIKSDKEEKFRLRQEEEKKKKELEKLQGIKTRGTTPKPINSPLYISTLLTVFYEGVINEYDVCKKLNISPDKLDRYIQ